MLDRPHGSETPPPFLKCKWCASPFPRKGRRLYCNNDCKVNARYARDKTRRAANPPPGVPYVPPLAICANPECPLVEFDKMTGNQKFCSTQCRNRVYNQARAPAPGNPKYQLDPAGVELQRKLKEAARLKRMAIYEERIRNSPPTIHCPEDLTKW